MTPVALLPSCTQFNWKQQGKDVCVECAAVTPEERSTGVLAAGRAVLAVTGEKGTVKGGVAAGDVEVVRAFLQAGGDVNLRVPRTASATATGARSWVRSNGWRVITRRPARRVITCGDSGAARVICHITCGHVTIAR